MAYLTEMKMTIEGTGQMAEMMRQMGAMKITVEDDLDHDRRDRRRSVQSAGGLHDRQAVAGLRGL